jgi:type IV pilus assembly protein PilV
MNRTLASSQRGVTMLEVLIAILIISVGLLGTAGLQAVSLRASIAANERTTATLLAYDAADRMRANKAGFALGAYHNYTATQNTNCLAAAGCTPQQLAQHDMWEWNNAITLALPSGMGIVCRDSSADDGTSNASLTTAACDGLGNQYVVKIWWYEDRSSSNPGGTLKRFATAVQP